MTAFLLTALFTACAALAIASIAASLRRYGPAALRLRSQLRECPEWREVQWRVTRIEVRTAGATVLRPEFGTTRRSVPQPALRAAA